MARKPILPDENGNYTESQISKLKSRTWNTAVWYLGKSPQTVEQLRQKLIKKQLPKEMVDETIDKLIQMKWLNDEAFVESFIYSKRTYEKLGVNAIRMKLLQKGVPRDIIDANLVDIDQDELYETAKVLAERKYRSLQKEPDMNKRVQKLVSFLAYRGYSSSVAYQVAKEITSE